MITLAWIRCATVWIICLLCPVLCSGAAGTFEFFQVPGAVALAPYSINATLNVTGNYTLLDGTEHGFLRAACGKVIRFDVGVLTTQPIRINAGGEIAGTYSDVAGFDQGFIRSPGGAITKLNLGGSGGFTEVTDLNANGVVIGVYSTTDASHPSQAYFRTRNGIVIPFTVTASTFVYPESINDAGAIAGFYLTEGGIGGFVRTPDGATTLFDFSQGIVPLTINQGGTITGWYSSLSGAFAPFVRHSGGMLTLFHVPGMLLTQYMDINQAGFVAGSYTTMNRFTPPQMGTHGFIRTPQGAVGSFDVPGAAVTMMTALNDSNVAIGYSDGPAGVQGFLLVLGDLFAPQ